LPKRVSLPAADDLFRPTAPARESTAPDAAEPAGVSVQDAAAAPTGPDDGVKRPSGRVRHDEKMTIYVTADELMDIEHARLALRRTHGLAVDRGRLVREAVAIALADFEQNGDDSVLVQRLIGP
jgi:hypothetical protein